MTDPRRVVIDTDPGIDDALALMLAARWQRCRLAAVTVVYGNTTLACATRNARYLLAREGRGDVPVLQGADRPLHRELVTAKETHGPEGLGDHALGAAPEVVPGAGALRDALRLAGEGVTLITLGPLTNLALALTLDPDLVKSRVGAHVAMAGVLEARGTMGEGAEFNVWCDPEAADTVFRAGLGTTLVSLDTTRQLQVSAAAVAKLAGHADSEARWLGQLLGFYVRFHQAEEQLHAAVINDPLAVALALEPGWAQTADLPLHTDLSEGPSRGRTTPDPGAGAAVRVVRSFDRKAVYELLREHLFGRWLSPADFGP